MNKVLIVVAHSDDETLGCGATISQHISKRDIVHVLVLTDSTSAQKKCVTNRRQEFDNAMNILGVNEVTYLDFKDNHLDSYALIEVIRPIEKVRDLFLPNIVYTHSNFDLNIDHQIVNKAVLTAFRPLPGSTVEEVYSFNIISSIEYSSRLIPIPQENHFVSLSKEDCEKKYRALECYKSEIKDFPHPRSLKYIRNTIENTGARIGVHAAESFYVELFIKNRNQ